MLRAQKSSTWQLNREGDSCWADSAHRIKNCLCTLSGSMQLVQKRASNKDKKMGQLLTLISDEIARLDSLVKDILIAGEKGYLHQDTHEMKDVLERASAHALECLGMKDSIHVEFRQPVAHGAVSADYKTFLWSWVTILSSVFKWAGPAGTVSYSISSFEHRATAHEEPRELIEVQLHGRKKRGEVVWDFAPNLEESFCGEYGEPSLKLARAVIERYGGEVELGLESPESSVIQVILPVATEDLRKQNKDGTNTRKGTAHGG